MVFIVFAEGSEVVCGCIYSFSKHPESSQWVESRLVIIFGICGNIGSVEI